MSAHFLRLISKDPFYLPSPFPQGEVQALLKSTFPIADEIRIIISDEVTFVDPGTNLERVVCPVCQSALSMDWWSRTMDYVYEQSRFTNLTVIVPCCQATTTLNDLQYEWPAGFARFVLAIRTPNAELDQAILDRFEQLLGCDLRVIWAHL